MIHVQRVLRDLGQSLLPMHVAPRDGRCIFGYSAYGDGMVYCHWDEQPKQFAGPAWVSVKDPRLGYVDRAFTGWYDPAKFCPLGETQIRRLLVAYIDDAREQTHHEVLSMLETPMTPIESNDNPR